jgi:hypothetical protein
MIEVKNINPINKGSLLAICDVHIIPWKMTLLEVKIFEKGDNRWITLPCKEYINEMGEKKYIELIAFDNDVIRSRFRGQIMKAIDDYMTHNPNLQPEDVIKNTEELPF